jgi:hypothetical protein
METSDDVIAFTFKGETFNRLLYNEISVLLRNRDGYCNGSALCQANGNDIGHLFETHQWKEDVAIFKKYSSSVPFYELPNTYPKELRGVYVNPYLIHSVIVFCNPEYRHKLRVPLSIEQLMQKNSELLQRCDSLESKVSNLQSRAVPDEYQYIYSYLVYQEEEDKYNSRIFKLVRRQTENIEKHMIYRLVIENKLYFFYAKNLPISMTINKKVIEICFSRIRGCRKLSKERIQIPLTQLDRFREIIISVVYEGYK